jgi:hypothetical protein
MGKEDGKEGDNLRWRWKAISRGGDRCLLVTSKQRRRPLLAGDVEAEEATAVCG